MPRGRFAADLVGKQFNRNSQVPFGFQYARAR